MAHDEHLLLFRWQLFDKLAEACLGILLDLRRLGRILCEIHRVEKPAVVFEDNFRVPAVLPVGVDGEVVRNPADPGQKLAFLVVPPAFDGVDGLNKGLLEQIFCPVTIFHDQVNGRENARFVTMDQHFECPLVTLLIAQQQFAVSAILVYHSDSRLGNVEMGIDSVRGWLLFD